MEVSMSTAKINRFKLKSENVVTEKERYDEAQVKLNKMIENEFKKLIQSFCFTDDWFQK